MDGREAARQVRRCVVHKLGGPDVQDRVPDEPRPRHLECALDPRLMREIVRGMAARGRLPAVGGPAIRPRACRSQLPHPPPPGRPLTGPIVSHSNHIVSPGAQGV